MDNNFDLVVIGAGSGGVRAARIAATLGARVAIIEGRFFGGTCVNVGCVPKKMFAYASEFTAMAELAENYGFTAQVGAVNWPQLRGNKDKEISRLNGIYEQLLDGAGVSIFRGYGQVTANNTVTVNDQSLVAKHIIVATGGQPFMPDIPGAEHALLSDDLFVLPVLPKTAVVVGGGYIACEFASILNGLGVQVEQVYRGELFLRGFDDDIRQHVATSMAADGVALRFNTDVTAIEKDGSGKTIRLSDNSAIRVDEVFYATGRVPKVSNLFSGVDVATKANGAIMVNDQFETNVPGVYAIGDVIDRVQLTPVALAEGMWLANHLFGDASAQTSAQSVDYANIPTAVFSHPNIATIGLSQTEALDKHSVIRVYRSTFRPLRYTLGDIQQRTMMKLIVDDASDRVVGLHMAGEEAAEIVQGFAVAVRMGATKADFDRTIGIHPTSAEEFVTLRQGETIRKE
ncbi:MAG: glutathione-disulfide reductase [Gammaproteobacteria bacterium]|nr:glutathione-disulfide reductase [Gammaproteobacteria bacterium]MBQ0774709.1 glutathione-disulfide reductase [Gammaproteobacteria bacterium]